MTVDIDTSDLMALSVELGEAATRAGAKVDVVVRRSAARVEGEAKMFCPVDTGNLRSSIFTTVAGDGRSGSVTATIGPSAEYGGYVEYGTSRMPPHAYLGPALDRSAPDFIAGLAKAVEG